MSELDLVQIQKDSQMNDPNLNRNECDTHGWAFGSCINIDQTFSFVSIVVQQIVRCMQNIKTLGENIPQHKDCWITILESTCSPLTAQCDVFWPSPSWTCSCPISWQLQPGHHAGQVHTYILGADQCPMCWTWSWDFCRWKVAWSTYLTTSTQVAKTDQWAPWISGFPVILPPLSSPST